MGTETNRESSDPDGTIAERPGNGTGPAAGSTAPKVDGGSDTAYDATVMAAGQSCSKMERDVAFAAVALKSGRISERQLSKAVSDWTVYGDETLELHLSKKGLISNRDQDVMGAETERVLQNAFDEAAATSAPAGDSLATVHRLDASGRIGRMLGLSLRPDWESHGQERNVIAQYRLLKKLGEGGLGCVWLARDENLQRFVAVKEVNDKARNSPAALMRFRREAEVTGRLEHPSIVPVYQFGEEIEQGRQFYAMRYLGKQTLEDAIAEYHERREAGDHDPMLLHRLLTAFVAICQVIGYAHSRNVVHRDLKPENVALDNFGQVIVLDWGLAKLIGDAELDENLTHDASDGFSGDGRTMAGQVLGTPMYMAPEQAAGRHDEIDHRTDVYGLGAILFAILTGYAPHEKSHSSLSTGSKVTELFRAIVTNPTPPARSIVPDVPPELDAICTKAMARKRYARYDSASDLADDVQKWTAGEPVSSYAEPWPKQLQRWIGAHRLFSQIAAVLFTVFVVVVTTLSVTSRQNRLAARQARFDILKSEGRELEVRLQHGMRHLTQEVRFMSALPPIQGIIDARSGQGTDEEHVWQERLQTIYKGLLNSQPDYLSVQYVSVAEPAQEIVRVERQASDGSFVRVVPESRLANLESTGPLASIAALHPGDVFLADAPLSHTLQQTELAQALVLTAGIPVFDDTTGEIFGAVAIRTNLEKTLRELISATSKTAAAVYIVGGDSNVVLHYSRGRGFQRVAGRQNIGALVAEVGPFFAQKQTSDVYSAGEEVYAFKIPLDERHANTTLGIVLTLR